METNVPKFTSGPLSQEEETNLKEAMRRCSPETVEAALAFRKTGEISHIPVLIIGIIERFLEPDVRPRLKEGNDELRLLEDLGVDSLTIVEIVILVEETLNIKIDNEELKQLSTIKDIKTFIECKIKGVPLPKAPERYKIEDIDAIMPHKQPFLFLQEVTLEETEAKGTYPISGTEFFLEGHFKDNPIFPASIMLEALGQLAVFYLLKTKNPNLTNPVDPSKILFTSCDGVRCHHICRPNDTLSLSVKVKKIKHPLAVFEGHISCNSQKAVFAEQITLTFDYLSNPEQNAQ